MIKLICKKCNKAWYTANTRSNQRCSDCNGLLVEEELDLSKSNNIIVKPEPSENGESKVIYLKW